MLKDPYRNRVTIARVNPNPLSGDVTMACSRAGFVLIG